MDIEPIAVTSSQIQIQGPLRSGGMIRAVETSRSSFGHILLPLERPRAWNLVIIRRLLRVPGTGFGASTFRKHCKLLNSYGHSFNWSLILICPRQKMRHSVNAKAGQQVPNFDLLRLCTPPGAWWVPWALIDFICHWGWVGVDPALVVLFAHSLPFNPNTLLKGLS